MVDQTTGCYLKNLLLQVVQWQKLVRTQSNIYNGAFSVLAKIVNGSIIDVEYASGRGSKSDY